MKRLNAVLIVIALIVGFAAPAHANACSSRAQAEASRFPGATATGQPATNGQGQTVCSITIRIPPQNGKPRRVIKKTVKL